MSENRRHRRRIIPGYIRAYVRRRRFYLAIYLTIMIFLAVLIAILLYAASSLPDYGRNLSLNIAADLIGTVVALFILTPFIERAELRRDAVLERFDHRAFIRQVADARYQILILEMWTNLLEDDYQQPFLHSLRAALDQNVDVRVLMLDPDARAAQQRANDLPHHIDVVGAIMNNLLILYNFRHNLSEELQERIEVRIYSALPPVQIYRVDDFLLVSFYPANITSWNAAQYQTGPRTQLGEFVCAKFDELWEAPRTRTLDQFRSITVRVDSGEDQRSYQAQFVTLNEEIYVWGREIVAGHLNSGICELPARIVYSNAKGELKISEPYSFLPLDTLSEDRMITQELFTRKYGREHREVILQLVTKGKVSM